MISTILFNSIWILPLIAVLVCAPISRSQTKTIKRIHLTFAGIVLAIAAGLVYYTYTLTMPLGIPSGNKPFVQYLTDFEWLPAIHAHYTMATDALGILLVFLTAVIVFTGMLASWKVDHQQKEFFALMQLLGTAVYGVFMSFDLVLFFIFYEMEALCMYLMIAGWGTGNKDYGGKKLTLTLALGSAMVLSTLFGIFIESGATTWNILSLADVKLPMSFQMWAFPMLFMGFAVSGSLFPFHFWSPDGHASAPTAVSMLAAGVMMKMGPFACLRVAIYLMPEAAKIYLPYIAFLVIFNVAVACFIAIRHRDLKYITAYSSISHLGLIFLGLAAATPLAFRGAALQMLSHGFLTGLFFASIGMIYGRTHTRNIDEMGGLMRIMPFLGVAFTIAGFAGLGLPGLSGFVAETSIFIGSFQSPIPHVKIVTILGILSITATAVYILQTANRMLSGPVKVEKFKTLTDADFIEKTTLVIIVACLFGIGLFPGWISEFLDTAIAPIYANLMR
ncbi:MAG: NADH-quinone oxidoreductase subunit M [Hallerella porci]|uniref:complex I subunit 4 family protein n=1 Tax=Hallerella porci TaxID=1945871 RepID=UPI002A833868|nr:NADH-quinone oxidoreductase subunit M [Hallerella porci]MDY3921028.1 NADH-quinone oxidoreductase subunit M [Hallerella porci]